jgi:hypothetical protein
VVFRKFSFERWYACSCTFRSRRESMKAYSKESSMDLSHCRGKNLSVLGLKIPYRLGYLDLVLWHIEYL